MPRRGRSVSPTPRSAPMRNTHRQAGSSAAHATGPTAPARSAATPHLPTAAPSAAMSPAAAAPTTQGPSLMGQMAATAGGVAIGSVVGHAVTGLFSGRSNEAEPAQEQAPMMQQPQHVGYGAQEQGPCAFEIKQFLECAQTQSDLTLCQGFNEAMSQCKMRYNM